MPQVESDVFTGNASDEKYKADIIYKVLFALQMPVQSLANYIGLIFVLITASAMVRAGSITAIQMKELMLYFNIFMADATLVIGVWMSIKATHGGCEKIAELNAAPSEDISDTDEISGTQDIIFDDVSYGYTKERQVLKNASFTIPGGKITAIVGENGSGKSTITRLLERFDEPDSGTIRVGKTELYMLDGTKWRVNHEEAYPGDVCCGSCLVLYYDLSFEVTLTLDLETDDEASLSFYYYHNRENIGVTRVTCRSVFGKNVMSRPIV